MGLLDIWKDWRSGAYSPKGYEWGSQETDVDIGSSFPARTDLNTAGGTNNTYQGTKQKRGDFTNTDPKYIRENQEVRNRLSKVIETGYQMQNLIQGLVNQIKKLFLKLIDHKILLNQLLKQHKHGLVMVHGK